MSWFNKSKKNYPTKMFVNYLDEPSKKEDKSVAKTKSFSTSMLSTAMGVQGVAIDMALSVAPEMIDKGMKFMSDTLQGVANDKKFLTTVKRNFDIKNPVKVSLPSKITIVRGKFASQNSTEGEIFGDGEKKTTNQSMLIGDKELHIEIEIIKSKDSKSIYLQPTRYFHAGKSSDGKKVDEIVLAFAFLTPTEHLLDVSNINFQNFLHFTALESNTMYEFKSKSGYDNSFQSEWMNAPLSEPTPYTMVIEIQEIRSGNSFARLLQTVYMKNQNYIKTGVTNKINNIKE